MKKTDFWLVPITEGKCMELLREKQSGNAEQLDVTTLVNPRIECHFHSEIELLYVESGNVDVYVGDKHARLCEGNFAAIGCFEFHNISSDGDAFVRQITIPVRKISDFFSIFKNKSFTTPFFKGLDNGFGKLIGELERASEENNQLSVKGYAYLLIGKTVELLGVSEIRPRSDGIPSVVCEMLYYIDEHFTDDLSLDRVASDLGYNKDYLSRVFNEALGKGFCKYLNHIRIRYATRLISTTDLSAERISDMSGFGSTHTFYDFFRDVNGCTPGEFRKRINNGNMKQK